VTSTPLARWALATGAIRADGTLVDPLTGMIDELVIYDRALSPSGILAHYQAIPEPTVLSLGVLAGLAFVIVRGGLRRR